MSANPEALAAYEAGMLALRQASVEIGHKALTRAVDLDPQFAIARLRLVLSSLLYSQPIISSDLEPVQAAVDALGTHDRALLDAMLPLTLSPADPKENERRLRELTQKYPADADLHVQLAIALDNVTQPFPARAELDVAIRLDPSLALAWMIRGLVSVEIGDQQGQRAALDRCLEIAASSTSCLATLAATQSHEGKCVDLVGTSRRLIALTPENSFVYHRLAEGLFSSGRPIAEVRAALEQEWANTEPSLRRKQQLLGEAALATLDGDLAEAERRIVEVQGVVTEPEDALQFPIAYAEMLLALERGHAAQAGARAARYLRERKSWLHEGLDPSLYAQAVMLAAGAISEAQYEAFRRAWLDGNEESTPVWRWLEAYAAPVQSREQALIAVAARPDVHPLMNALSMLPSIAERDGRVYLLAAREEEALPLLLQASSSCAVIDTEDALFADRATLELGEVLEGRGERASACIAYQKISGRSGHRAGSMTGSQASARWRALACGI